MAEDGARKKADAPDPSGEKMSEAEIDRNLMGTFPASDPPSWTLGTDHRDESPASPANETGRNGNEE